MMRVFVREISLSLVTLALVAAAAWCVAAGIGPFVVPWRATVAGRSPATLGRDVLYLLLAVSALAVVGRLIAQAFLLRRLGYAPAAHLGKALRRPWVRRAGALAGVALAVGEVAGGASAFAGPTPLVPAPAPRPHPTAVRGSAMPPRRSAPNRPRPMRRLAHVRRGGPRPLPVAGDALRYTVQPGDTISLVAARLAPEDPTLTARIWQASRAAPQPDGLPAITDPHWIYPGQTLLVPLPLPHVSVVGNGLLYIVQPGDDEALIAARLLGSWTRYRELVPVNAVVTDDNLIHPGLILRLPADALVAPMAPPHPAPMALPHRTVARPTRRWQPIRRTNPRPVRRAQPRRPILVPARSRGHPVHPRHVLRKRQVVCAAPAPAVARPIQPRRPSGGATRPPLRSSPPEPPQPTPTRSASTPRHTPLQTIHVTPAPVPLPSPPSPSRLPALPLLRVPGEDRLLSLAFVLAFLGVCAVAARHARGRRTAAGVSSAATNATAAGRSTRVVPVLTAATGRMTHGARTRFADLLGRAAARRSTGAIVAHVAATLAACGAAEGIAVDLATATRRATEGAETLDLLIEARRLTAESLARVAARLAAALGTTVTPASRVVVDADGTACRVITVRTAGITAPPAISPHPAPLLIPLGRDATGAVAHVNLARLDALLIAGEARSAHHLVGTLLASVLVQAPPTTLRLLVATADDELCRALPAAYLDAPVADADDVTALAGIVTQAHDLVSARFVAGDAGPVSPMILVLLDKIERLSATPRLVDRLEAVCRNGRACGVHVIATTAAPAALAAAGLLPAFSGRLVRRLTEETSRAVWGAGQAATLGEDEVLLRAGPGSPPDAWANQLVPFTLTPREVAQVLDVAARAVSPAPPGDGSSPIPTTVDGEVQGAANGVDLPADGPDSAADEGDGASEGASDAGPDPSSDGPDPSSDGPDPSAATGTAPPTGADSYPADKETAAVAERDIATQPDESATPHATEASCDAAGVEVADAPAQTTGKGDGTGEPGVAMQLFGETTITVGDTPVELYPREARILAVLALKAPHAVAAETIAETLFPDRDSAKGIDAVWKAVGVIRASLRRAGVAKDRASAVIVSSNTGYALSLAHVDLDLARFERLVRLASTAARQERGRLLAEAAALAARGDVCATEDMLEHHREPWRKRVRETLYELIEYYERVEKAPAAALHIAQRLTVLDPYNDHYHQEVLGLLDKLKDNAGVEAHYRRMRLDYADAGIPLDPYTQALMDKIRERRRARVGKMRERRRARVGTVPDDADANNDDSAPRGPETLVS